MKVGLIDPALRREGHHVQFLGYLYSLLREAGFEVVVADFADVVRHQSAIPSEDIVTVADWVPTEAFVGRGRGVLARMANACRKVVRYSALRLRRLGVDAWLIATYDPHSLMLLRYGGVDISKAVLVIHYMKFFRRGRFRPFGITSYWTPYFLFQRLKQAAGALCLLQEHTPELQRLGYTGRCEYLSYNATPQRVLDVDNRSRLSAAFRICTVGIIRPDKDIALVLKALASCPEVEYFIGGQPDTGVEESDYFREICALWESMPQVTTHLEALPPAEYRRQIELAHFAVVPIGRKYGDGMQQTGLLVDSLVNRRPVIGPDLYPVNKWVREYGVGVLYRPGSAESLADAIRQARAAGVESFYPNILRFLRENSFERYAATVKGVLLGAGMA